MSMRPVDSSGPSRATGVARPPHRRRPRYKGTHPRRFHEKYKEHDAERYPGVAARVSAKGKTPAGSHRPIMVDEVLGALQPAPGLTALDATLGHGGHAAALLPLLLPGGRLIGLDADPIELPRTVERLRSLGFGEEALITVRTNFAAIEAVLSQLGIRSVDLVLADLGCSSMQIDDPVRGFTYKEEGPLDLRFNPRRGEPAWALLARLPADALAALLRENADEPLAGPIAAAIAARASTIRTTTDLAGVVRGALGGAHESPMVGVTLQRVFQALRIAVNDEMAVLDRFLDALPRVLALGGRAAILTFHSGEDRRVKKALAAGLAGGAYCRIASDPQRPSAEEVRANPRSRSAKLRWCRRATHVEDACWLDR